MIKYYLYCPTLNFGITWNVCTQNHRYHNQSGADQSQGDQGSVYLPRRLVFFPERSTSSAWKEETKNVLFLVVICIIEIKVLYQSRVVWDFGEVLEKC